MSGGRIELMKRYLLIPALLLLLSAVLVATPLAQEFEVKVQAAPSEKEALPIIQEYLTKMTDVEDFRILQNYWMRADKAACQAYFAERHQQEPASPVFHYLWLRNAEDNAVQLAGSRSLVINSPDFYWGYRLFSATYSQILVNPDSPAALKKDVQEHLVSDLAILQQGLKRSPADDYLRIALFHYYNSQNDVAAAEDQLVRLNDPGAIENNFENVLDFVATSKRTTAFEVLFPKLLSSAIAKGDMQAADSLGVYQSYFLQVLKSAEAWERMSAYFDANPDLKTQDETLENRIEMNIGLKKLDTALNLLEGAMAIDALSFPEVENNPAYESLHALPRWTEVITLAGKIWQQNKTKRKTDALAKKIINRPAPLWELPDKDGQPVTLESLRGKIVVLDFWATWCKPCMKTMPLLDTWIKKNPSEDVSVISVSTWESPAAHDQVLAYMREGNYSMKLLFGNNELPKAYGFTGIPYICVIDKQGNIAFELNGYSKDIPELMDFWVEDLRK